MRTKKRAAFVAVLPAMLLASCTQSAIKTNNPPEPEPTTTQITNPPEPATKESKPPEGEPPTTTPTPPITTQMLNPPLLEPKYPPISYSKREKKSDGKCYVRVYVNPPYQVEVSCSAPIEPATDGGKWCAVASAKDPAKKVSVDCASK